MRNIIDETFTEEDMTEYATKRDVYEIVHGIVNSEVNSLAAIVAKGFERVELMVTDLRNDMNRRFDEVNLRIDNITEDYVKHDDFKRLSDNWFDERAKGGK